MSFKLVIQRGGREDLFYYINNVLIKPKGINGINFTRTENSSVTKLLTVFKTSGLRISILNIQK